MAPPPSLHIVSQFPSLFLVFVVHKYNPGRLCVFSCRLSYNFIVGPAVSNRHPSHRSFSTVSYKTCAIASVDTTFFLHSPPAVNAVALICRMAICRSFYLSALTFLSPSLPDSTIFCRGTFIAAAGRLLARGQDPLSTSVCFFSFPS